MTAKYTISTTGTVSALRITEFGEDRPHNFEEAPTLDHDTGKDVVVQWVLTGDQGASLELKFKNDRGTVDIVKESKITAEHGIRESGAVFRIP